MMLDEQDFDWVTARDDCTTAALFALLVSAIQRDVKRMEKIDKARGDRRRFVVNTTETDCRVVRTPGGHQPMNGGIAVSLADNGLLLAESIHPNHSRKCLFTATAQLQNDGKCRLAIGSTPLHFGKLASACWKNFSSEA